MDEFGLMPFWKLLKSTGMGHHPMPRVYAKKYGFPLLGTNFNSPSWYPYELEGSDLLHKEFHDAIRKEGISFNGSFKGTSEEVVEKLNKAYKPFKQRGYMKIPKTGEILAKNVTIQGALNKSLEWDKKQKIKIGAIPVMN
ncbi:hypothetical protein EIM92_11470 [Paenibacillus lentus]|uniref:Uncharacterized protein n=1 Tax=Paenibacillus lentus TaxID=1338368 RepID=A0A3S8RUP0_9BACL|nr:hypothetical protein EIM92_11470 [Paenibacillus lentus]